MRLGVCDIQEWHCFRKVSVDLSKVGIASVIGRLSNNPEKSNGAGKSYFIESVPYALFGYDREPPSIQRLKAKDDTYVEWNFHHRGKNARVKRGFKIKKDGSKGAGILEFEIDGVKQGDKVGDIQAAIEKFVGCNCATYQSTSFFTQGDADRFAITTPADRKRILSNLLGLEAYETYRTAAEKEIAGYEAALSDIQSKETLAKIAHDQHGRVIRQFEAADLHGDLKAQEALIEALVALQGDYPASLSGVRSFMEAIPDLTATVNSTKAALAKAKASLASAEGFVSRSQAQRATRYKALAEEYRHRQERIRGVPGMEAALAELSKQLTEACAARDSIVIEDKAPYRAAESHANAMIGEANAQMRAAELAIKQIDTLGVKCGSCLQSIGPEHKERHRAEAKDRYEAALANRTAATARRQEAEAKQTEIDSIIAQRRAAEMRVASLQPRLEADTAALAQARRLSSDHQAAIEASKTEMAEIDRAIAGQQEEVLEASNAVKEAEATALAAQEALAAVRDSIDEGSEVSLARLNSKVVARYKAAVDRRDQIRSDIRAYEMAKEKAAEAQRVLVEIETKTRDARQKIEVLRFLAKVFSKNGIPHLVAENVVAEIEKGTVDILQALESQNRIIFRTATDTGGDTIQIEVETPDGSRGLKSFSGGQVTEQNLAIRLALGEVLARRAEVSFDSIFLDEVMAPLDAPGRQCFLQVVNLMRRSFSQIFVISHHNEIRDFLESRIAVEWHPDGATVQVS